MIFLGIRWYYSRENFSNGNGYLALRYSLYFLLLLPFIVIGENGI